MPKPPPRKLGGETIRIQRQASRCTFDNCCKGGSVRLAGSEKADH